MTQLILSLFPGIGMLDAGFEQAGYCVVRGPDLIYGGDIRRFNPPPDVFVGVIGGPPCPPFSKASRDPDVEHGMEMLNEFVRCIEAARPQWWLMENVPAVPDVVIDGYTHQRLDLRASEFGLNQSRLRHFQFGHCDMATLILARSVTTTEKLEPCCMASEGRKHDRRDWETFTRLQGLPAGYDLPLFSVAGKYRAVGNGVPVPMAAAIANAIKNNLHTTGTVTACACSCGRPVTGKKTYATAACRKRAQRKRDAAAASIPGAVTLPMTPSAACLVDASKREM